MSTSEDSQTIPKWVRRRVPIAATPFTTAAATLPQVSQSISLTNQAGAVTHFHYDVLDRLTDEIGFDGRHQRYIYNAASELTHLIEAGGSDLGPGKLTHYERDALGRLTAKRHEGSASEPAQALWQQPFNEAWAQVQASQHSRTDDTPPIDAAHANFAYDKLGRLSRASNALSSVEFAYDPLGNLLSESQTLSAPQSQAARPSAPEPKTHRFTHHYDPLGNRISTTLPSGQTLNHLYYGSGHLHQINLDGQVISDFERDALHRETRRTQGSLLSQFAYDPGGRLQGQRVSAANTATAGHQDATTGLPQQRSNPQSPADIAQLMRGVIERQYAYDGAGQLRQILDRSRGTTQYGYDNIGRITSSQIGLGKDSAALGTRLPGSKASAAANESFSWDAASNPVPTAAPDHAPGQVLGQGLNPGQRNSTANATTPAQPGPYRAAAVGPLVLMARPGQHSKFRFRWFDFGWRQYMGLLMCERRVKRVAPVDKHHADMWSIFGPSAQDILRHVLRKVGHHGAAL